MSERGDRRLVNAGDTTMKQNNVGSMFMQRRGGDMKRRVRNVKDFIARMGFDQGREGMRSTGACNDKGQLHGTPAAGLRY